MVAVITDHKVTDHTTWKAGFDADAARREQMGAKLLAVGQKMCEAYNVYMLFDVKDPNAIGQAMTAPAFQQQLKDFGVLSTEATVIE